MDPTLSKIVRTRFFCSGFFTLTKHHMENLNTSSFNSSIKEWDKIKEKVVVPGFVHEADQCQFVSLKVGN